MKWAALKVNSYVTKRKPVKMEKKRTYLDTSKGGLPVQVTVYDETLPNGVVHPVHDQGDSYFDNTRVFEVPADHYFMMGDNRDNSTDSRFAAVYRQTI